jgi:cellulose synthase/poly-beta-1,6-N-acetylglucosamine synthase-like glycosyltransferase
VSVIEIGPAKPTVGDVIPRRSSRGRRASCRPWWLASATVGAVFATLFLVAATGGRDAIGNFDEGALSWWIVTVLLHVPYLGILAFLTGGLIERAGYYWRGREPEQAGRLPAELPTVCVQLPMFNEHAVARRVIEAAAAMTWPRDRLSVQVLDDSTDDDTRALVDDVCAEVRRTTGVDCHVLRRTDRRGFKAGALEAGRLVTDAEFLVIFDADFVPPADFLERTVGHFYDTEGEPDDGLALVQAQWGHLNHDQSSLTRAQSLWVDDHHTMQMSWRSRKWQFVNFTGTAGVWRASAVERAGGWRAASLVEDCELSFRHLFAGYRTKFVKEIVVPAELPATYTAYKAQQRRWTQGWVQLQRLHLRTLLFRFDCRPLRRLHLLYHMCIAWQWPLWAIWTMTLPLMIYTGLWFGSAGTSAGVLLYLAPTCAWALIAATTASMETTHTYPDDLSPLTFVRRFRRVVPYLLINTGMLPHQFSSFAEGLFGGMHSEFERTPKAATMSSLPSRAANPLTSAPPARKVYPVKVHWPYVLAEGFYVLYQIGWAVLFASTALVACALGAAYMAACVLAVAYFYGDHIGKVAFVFSRPRRPPPDRARATDRPDLS